MTQNCAHFQKSNMFFLSTQKPSSPSTAPHPYQYLSKYKISLIFPEPHKIIAQLHDVFKQIRRIFIVRLYIMHFCCSYKLKLKMQVAQHQSPIMNDHQHCNSRVDHHAIKNREVRNWIKGNSVISSLLKQDHGSREIKIVHENRKIKPKMFTKLANWMEKTTTETLEFSLQTYEIALRIIISFLNYQDETPGNLQLLGCVSLHLASKINESRIVSIDSYMECCMNIFDKKKFQQKEFQVYQKLSHKIQTNTFHGVWSYIEDQLDISEENAEKWRKIINNLIKDPNHLILDIEALAINLIIWNEKQNSEVNFQAFVHDIKESQLLL